MASDFCLHSSGHSRLPALVSLRYLKIYSSEFPIFGEGRWNTFLLVAHKGHRVHIQLLKGGELHGTWTSPIQAPSVHADLENVKMLNTKSGK